MDARIYVKAERKPTPERSLPRRGKRASLRENKASQPLRSKCENSAGTFKRGSADKKIRAKFPSPLFNLKLIKAS